MEMKEEKYGMTFDDVSKLNDQSFHFDKINWKGINNLIVEVNRNGIFKDNENTNMTELYERLKEVAENSIPNKGKCGGIKMIPVINST